jgi:hypothetical protein
MRGRGDDHLRLEVGFHRVGARTVRQAGAGVVAVLVAEPHGVPELVRDDRREEMASGGPDRARLDVDSRAGRLLQVDGAGQGGTGRHREEPATPALDAAQVIGQADHADQAGVGSAVLPSGADREPPDRQVGDELVQAGPARASRAEQDVDQVGEGHRGAGAMGERHAEGRVTFVERSMGHHGRPVVPEGRGDAVLGDVEAELPLPVGDEARQGAGAVRRGPAGRPRG